MIGDLALFDDDAIGIECANGVLLIAKVDTNGDVREIRAKGRGKSWHYY